MRTVSQNQPTVSPPHRVGLIGFGAIAREILHHLHAHAIDWVVLTRSPPQATEGSVRFVTSIDQLVTDRPDIVIEVAGQEALASHVPILLAASIPVIAASVGALADEELLRRLIRLRNETATKLIFPAGSIGGLDYLAAIARLPDAEITYISRKPVAAWQAELAARNLHCNDAPICLFEGSATDAARLFPKNLNAALTLALAIHPATLRVKVVVDPDARGNTHEIAAQSAAGTAMLRFDNVASPANPKTSMITALSLAAALRGFLQLEGID